MKNFLTLLLVCFLTCTLGNAGLGAIHSSSSDFMNVSALEFEYFGNLLGAIYLGNNSDTWYKITPEKEITRLRLSGDNDPDLDMSTYNAEYFLNDQTFVNYSALNIDLGSPFDELSSFQASYLFDFGLFVGLNYFNLETIDLNFYTLAPGYRFAISDESYIALSLDYMVFDEADFEEIVGYDLDVMYYPEAAKVYLQYYSPTDESLFIEDEVYQVGGAVQLSDEVVIGLNYWGMEDYSAYDAGLTWDNETVLLDLQLGSIDEEGFYRAGAIFKLSETIGLGLEFFNFDPIDDNRIILKFKYENDASTFTFGYALEGDLYPSAYYLSYKYTISE